MKKPSITFLLILLMSMKSIDMFAHDIAVANSDGVTIYYTYLNNQTELAVSNYNNYSDSYTGNVVIPESVTYNDITYTVTSIGNYAFGTCRELKSVTIPNSVTNIGNFAFNDCSGLPSITIPNSVTSIGYCAFKGCKLKSVIIGAGVLFIDEYAFDKPVKVIWLANTPPSGYNNATGTVNYVANDQYSFSKGTKTVYKFLSSMFEVDGVKYVPVSPSERTCDAIDCLYNESAEHIKIGETVTYKGVLMNIKQVHPYACYENTHIKEVELSSQGNIGQYAFSSCNNLQMLDVSNQGIIGNNAFSSCASLKTAQISNQGAIENEAFYNCKGLETATIDNKGPIENNAFQSCTALRTATLGEQVTAIGDYTFDGCISLLGLVIPDAVTSIGSYAFQNCSMMESVKMGSGANAIATYTFSGCSSLNNLQIGSSVETIGTYAFNNCSSLPVIEIPQKVTKVDNNVFDGCTALKDVYIADRSSILTLGYHYYDKYSSYNKPLFADSPLDSVYIGGNISYGTDQYSGYSPFYRNTSLRSVKITDQETEISENEFYGCTNLKNVWIGDGVTTIGNWAFSGCSSLDFFAFGTNMETIGFEAFSDCVLVTKIISRALLPPSCGSQALDDINKWTCTLEVPKGTLTVYQNADQWKEFFFVEEGAPVIQKGDLDGNGKVDESDVMLLVNCILDSDNTLTESDGDLNEDGNIDMADVTLLIDIILEKLTTIYTISEGGTYTFNINMVLNDIQLNSNNGFLHTTYKDSALNITVDPNITGHKRVGTITITGATPSEGLKKMTLTIIQAGKLFGPSEPHVSPASLTYISEGGTQSIQAYVGSQYNRVGYAISTDGQDWVSVVNYSDYHLEITAKPNTTGAERTCTVTVYMAAFEGNNPAPGTKTEAFPITITQAAGGIALNSCVFSATAMMQESTTGASSMNTYGESFASPNISVTLKGTSLHVVATKNYQKDYDVYQNAIEFDITSIGNDFANSKVENLTFRHLYDNTYVDYTSPGVYGKGDDVALQLTNLHWQDSQSSFKEGEKSTFVFSGKVSDGIKFTKLTHKKRNYSEDKPSQEFNYVEDDNNCVSLVIELTAYFTATSRKFSTFTEDISEKTSSLGGITWLHQYNRRNAAHRLHPRKGVMSDE